MSALALLHPLSSRLRCVPTVRYLSNGSADVKKRKKRARVEENSGVQKAWERCSRCGEVKTGMGCGEGPARKKKGPAWSSSCSRNAHDQNVLVRRAQSRINQAAPKEVGKRASLEGWRWWPVDLLCSRNARPQQVRRKGVRSFLCSRSAHPPKGLARRPQSKAPHVLAWLSMELERRAWMDARSEGLSQITPCEESTSGFRRSVCFASCNYLHRLCHSLM